MELEVKFLVFVIMISVTTGFPEVGYNYRQPSGGNLIGSGTSGGFLGSSQTSVSSSSSFGGSSGFSGGHSSGHANLGGYTQTSSSAGYVQRPALIQKHIYVHVPPPEPEEFQQQKQISLGVPQKHYKIIFIKVPSAPSITQQQIALAAQNQEKTIVYVLYKKPDSFSDISVPQIQTTPPSRPEVYFIKYKAQRQTTATGGDSGPYSGSTSGGNLNIASTGISTLTGSGSSASTGSGFTGGSVEKVVPSTQYGPPGKSGPY